VVVLGAGRAWIHVTPRQPFLLEDFLHLSHSILNHSGRDGCEPRDVRVAADRVLARPKLSDRVERRSITRGAIVETRELARELARRESRTTSKSLSIPLFTRRSISLAEYKYSFSSGCCPLSQHSALSLSSLVSEMHSLMLRRAATLASNPITPVSRLCRPRPSSEDRLISTLQTCARSYATAKPGKIRKTIVIRLISHSQSFCSGVGGVVNPRIANCWCLAWRRLAVF
jgi:hypothetical protein